VNFKQHSDLRGEHAFLSPSKYHWVNYTEDKIASTFDNFLATQKGVELHAFACQAIQLGQRLPKSKKSLNQYVNDAIGYRMQPEQVLFYSVNAFGTADAISFKDNLLRIHDLKTGVSPVSIHQLEVYAAFFCLEYSVKPFDIQMELRIYQSDEVLIEVPFPETISEIMSKVIVFDKIIEKRKLEE
jgi:Protein of unknown function (DUF2800)